VPCDASCSAGAVWAPPRRQSGPASQQPGALDRFPPRHHLRATASKTVWLLLFWVICLCIGEGSRAGTPSSTKGYVVKEIRGGIYFLSDGAYNTVFAVSNHGVIVIDPLPTLGPKYLAAIAEVTTQPVTHIVYSHEHADHIAASGPCARSSPQCRCRSTASSKAPSTTALAPSAL
jgi:hypothetical protein